MYPLYDATRFNKMDGFDGDLLVQKGNRIDLPKGSFAGDYLFLGERTVEIDIQEFKINIKFIPTNIEREYARVGAVRKRVDAERMEWFIFPFIYYKQADVMCYVGSPLDSRL